MSTTRQLHAQPRQPTQPTSGVYRAEIEGLRTVAFLLVAMFHIWFNRVSGGVDVFFTVAGFLVTVTLLSQTRRYGSIRAGLFLGRLAMRLLPAATVVLAAVVMAILILRPYAAWRDGIWQVFASATYWENWFLAFNSIDYLAVDVSRSPVQHFWAMSIQGQFYIIWLLAFIVFAILAKATRRSVKRVAIVGISVLVAVSFAWSVSHTASDQQFAYFSTLTRVWEFGAGALLALVIDRIRIPAVVGAVASWVALVAIVCLGAVLPVADLFPGYVAAIPVISALTIIATGQQQAGWGATSILASKPLVWLGGLGYGVYLWHWPLLVFALEIQGRTRAGLKTGIAIIVLSLILAWLTKFAVEGPVLRARASVSGAARRVVLVVSVGSVALLASTSAAGVLAIDHRTATEQQAAEALKTDPCFGAGTLLPGNDCDDANGTESIPSDPASDLSAVFSSDCSTELDKSDLRRCTWGAEDSQVRIVLIGNSHAAVWFPALRQVAEANDWRLDTYYRQSCTYNTAPRPAARQIVQDTCDEWNSSLSEILADTEPYDYVVTSAMGVRTDFYDRETGETDPAIGIAGYHEVWKPLIDRGATVIAVRDYPRLDDKTNVCALEKFRSDCSIAIEDALIAEEDEVLLSAAKSLDGAEILDMTAYFCRDGQCPTTIGNVHVYRDRAHFTATYGETLGGPLERELRLQVGMPSQDK